MSAAEKLSLQKESRGVMLIIEESPLSGEIERNYFGSVGFDTKLATSTSQAEALLKSEHFDILLVDMSFAGNKGLAMVKRALQVSQNPALKIMVSALKQTPALRKKITEAGAHAFVTKPAPRQQLLKEVVKLSSQESRAAERVREKLSLECQIPSLKRSFESQTLDLSSEGVHVQYSVEAKAPKPEVGTAVCIILLFKDQKLSLNGEIVRHTALGIGVKFVDLNKVTQRSLDKHLLINSVEHKSSHFYL
jgi:DNA-binding response OmpR family regulator